MELSHAGHRIVVRKNDGHREYYLWIDVDDRHFFLGVLLNGMTRREVRAMALRWLREHPNALASPASSHVKARRVRRAQMFEHAPVLGVYVDAERVRAR